MSMQTLTDWKSHVLTVSASSKSESVRWFSKWLSRSATTRSGTHREAATLGEQKNERRKRPPGARQTVSAEGVESLGAHRGSW